MRVSPLLSVPDTTLNRLSLPTNGSAIVLNMRITTGAFSSGLSSVGLSFSSKATTGLASAAEGIMEIRLFIRLNTPKLASALPPNTPIAAPSFTPCFMPLTISSAESSPLSKNFIRSSSSLSAAFSITTPLSSPYLDFRESGKGCPFSPCAPTL